MAPRCDSVVLWHIVCGHWVVAVAIATGSPCFSVTRKVWEVFLSRHGAISCVKHQAGVGYRVCLILFCVQLTPRHQTV